MLQFFRRHQKILFIFTTIIVVASFVFFGTYQLLDPFMRGGGETTSLLFVAPNNRKIKSSYFDQMCRFLAVEPEATYDPARALAANPLNSGVISNYFLQSELGYLLLDPASPLRGPKLHERLAKESLYRPYQHAQHAELSAQNVWALFAPEIGQTLTLFQQSSAERTKENFLLRSRLYLSQLRFPATLLKQVLCYQDYERSKEEGVDRALQTKDLSLFGYKDLNDWFGTEFVQSCAKVIIYGAEVAKQKGIRISQHQIKEEIESRARQLFEVVQKRIELPVNNLVGFIQLLRENQGLSEEALVKIYEDLLYFERYLEDIKERPIVDSMAFSKFYDYANESKTVRVTELPQTLRFKSFEELEEFELYLSAVADRKDNLVTLPSQFAPIDSIASRAPELVGRRYLVDLVHLSRNELFTRIPLKMLWSWQESHFDELKNHFSGIKEFAALEHLNASAKESINNYSYERICKENPEWIVEALSEKSGEEKELFLRFEQKSCELLGISDLAALRDLFDSKDRIEGYSQDGEHYYTITVKQRFASGEILSFEEAKKTGALKELIKRGRKPAEMEKLAQMLWKSLKEMRIEPDLSTKEKEQKALLAYRFYPYLYAAKKDHVYKEGFSQEYYLTSSLKKVTRAESEFISFDKIQSEGSDLSDIIFDEKGGPCFYGLVQMDECKNLPFDKVCALDGLLVNERRHQLIQELLQMIHHN